MSCFHHHTLFPNMASCTTTTSSSSLMLTHPSSSILTPQDLSPSSLRSFPRTFFLSPLVLKPSKSVNLTYQSRSSILLSSAVAADVAETVDEDEKDDVDDVAETVTVVTTKPKKGKAALLLKSDRVIFFKFYCFLDGFLLNFINYNWGSGFVDY